MYWGHFHPFGFVFFLLLIGLFVANIVMWRRRRFDCRPNRDRSQSILRERLASGEIDHEEFKRLKGHLDADYD
jgi:uncharacterized membrane protein